MSRIIPCINCGKEESFEYLPESAKGWSSDCKKCKTPLPYPSIGVGASFFIPFVRRVWRELDSIKDRLKELERE